jgi:general secretion pathway protein A
MYESFFGFKEKPFNITPDPKYLYLSGQHQEAIAHLLYGIRERGGFVVVTGEIGTGKTTLCRYLINQMDDQTEGAVILNPNLSEIELLKSINQDFGIDSSGQTKRELINELNRFLLEERLRSKNMVLIIDEAQNLEPEVMEQIRMLSNLETEKEKLIQIILIGQPQLKALLARPELRQLDQRVTARYHLRPLNRKETLRYIQHRLDVAGAVNKVVFEPAAMRRVYAFSRGTPRLINVVCDRALLGAFVAGQRSPISKKIVKQAIAEVTGTRYTYRERFSFHGAAAKFFVYSFLLLVGTILTWYAVTTLGAMRKAHKSLEQTELIPDTPIKPVAGPAAFAASAVAVPRGGPDPSANLVENKQQFIQTLLAKSYEESRLGAMRDLLALWGKHPRLTSQSVNSFYTLAVAEGMRCTDVWTNFDGLRASNTPCLLEMFVPQEMRPRYAVLASLGTQSAQIYYGDGQPQEVSLQLLDQFWLRRAFIFWKDFENVEELIKPGDYGGQVVWLQAGLQMLGLYSGSLTGTYDAATEESVRRFQQRNNLLLDGIVGPRTRLVLYANLGRYSMPRLNGGNT